MTLRTALMLFALVAVSACGLLDPDTQQRLLYGQYSGPVIRENLAAEQRRDAGLALIHRSATEKDPASASWYLYQGERLLQ